MASKYKRGFGMIDTQKEINCWVYRNIKNEIYQVCSSPEFLGSDDYWQADLSVLKPLHQKRSTSIQSKSKHPTAARKSEKDELNEFFDEQAKTMDTTCNECGKKLHAYTQWAKRCCTAHIFPKQTFKSIMTNPLNIFYLGADLLGRCHHHDFWDKSDSDSRKTMNVYSLALERFEMLKPSMTKKEIINAYEYLGLPLTQEILNSIK